MVAETGPGEVTLGGMMPVRLERARSFGHDNKRKEVRNSVPLAVVFSAWFSSSRQMISLRSKLNAKGPRRPNRKHL